ncbi:MAG: proline dehydrogenase family protein [Ignavibacteriales bacterium]|nr:MAG: proline dehydrogenase family protein [Ignavibacteriales bacterium]
MKLGRNVLLWCSQNEWMKKNIPQYAFVKRALKRFMPGERLEDALNESLRFKDLQIGTVLTHLGENINSLTEAASVTNHYLSVLKKIDEWNTPAEISLKLTQIGFDLSPDETKKNFKLLAEKSIGKNNFLWIDMEQSSYVERTLDFYQSVKTVYANTGVCLQAYLLRTKNDIEKLADISPNIRLVKGAYKEPFDVAFKEKQKTDENYFELSKTLLELVKKKNCRVAFGTHDMNIISKIEAFGRSIGIDRKQIEFQMLYGIRTTDQVRLATKGYNVKVLISYGSAWYPWYVRRLAERPANVMFVLKNIFK